MPPHDARAIVERYHDGTKHHFHAFAPSLGYLDWANQPDPFRIYTGAPVFPLYPSPGTHADDRAAPIGDMLRHALGLSAWKRYGGSRWSLRVNPSSGNLHPTEAYVIAGGTRGLADGPGVYHYAADRHALELRCAFADQAWPGATDGGTGLLLVALTSIHWRESWKYGERAFRYCQHDLGHAIAAVGIAAGLVGWRAMLLPSWSHRSIAAVTGIDRDADFVEAEREEPACIMALAPDADAAPTIDAARLIAAIRDGRWLGRASQLSEDHVQWTFIDEAARATEDHGRTGVTPIDPPESARGSAAHAQVSRGVILERRSALAFDGRSTIERPAFFRMLSRVMPDRHEPPGGVWWTPRIHLVLFVHRVADLAPGVYLLARERRALDRLKAACRRDFAWEPAHDDLPFVCLARGDCRSLAARLSCNQDIAGDSFFSLGMLADFDASLDEYGAPFYRNLFWESGVVGQVLYLEAEAAGAGATGIGCFFDDPVHDVLGLEGHAFQSLYHFTVGMPVEDTRLTAEPGYAWEA